MADRYCDVCGAPVVPGVVCVVRYGYLYCPNCEEIHHKNELEQIQKKRA